VFLFVFNASQAIFIIFTFHPAPPSPHAFVFQVRKMAVTTRVMQLVHEVLSKGIHVTKRDMFYT